MLEKDNMPCLDKESTEKIAIQAIFATIFSPVKFSAKIKLQLDSKIWRILEILQNCIFCT